MPRTLLYVAYPMRLDLGAANAIQTYNTVRELRRILPGTRLVVPRWLREPSAFTSLGALHLPRPAINKVSRFVPWAGWSYLERTLYSFMLVVMLVTWRLRGRSYPAIYVRDAVCAAWLANLSQVHGSRVIYEVHDLEASHPSKASKWPGRFWTRFLPWIDRSALKGATRLVSLTQTFKDWAVRRGIRKADQIAVIPDAFDPAMYSPVSREEAREMLDLPRNAFVIGYTGLTFAYRRLDLLVEAFAPVARRADDALLLLVGGRPQEVADLRALAERLGIPASRLVMPGQVSQERSVLYLQAADVLVIPDTVTGLTASPLKLFEYMAAGKPIVCKETPALREILGDDSAIFFPAGNVAALRDAIEELRDNRELAARLGSNAQALSTRYTYEARARKIAEVVKDCL